MSLGSSPRRSRKVAAGTDATGWTARKKVLAKLNWPGRPAPVVPAAPLTPEQQKRYAAGAEVYKNVCVGCHQEDGRGGDKARRESRGFGVRDGGGCDARDVRVVLGGKEGAIGMMPPLGAS